MASFDSGVSSYIRGRAIVEVFFPVDGKGNVEIACTHCWYYSESSKRCLLNNEKPSYPSRYVGYKCPLNNDDDFVKECEAIKNLNYKEEKK